MKKSLLAAAACGAMSAPFHAAVSAGDFGEPRVAVEPPRDPALCHLAWPKLVRLPDGTMVLSCVAAARHSGGRGRVAVAVSADDGGTFSPPAFPPDPPGAEPWTDRGNNAMGVAPDGAVLLFGMAFAGTTANGILGWRSADAGRSWEAVDTGAISFNRTGSVFGHILDLPGRGLAVFGHTRPPDRPKGGLWTALSRDGGRTWGPPSDICGRRELYEPDVALADGRLVLLARDDAAAGYQQFTSDDLGGTWNGPELVMGDGGAVHGHPSPCILADPAKPGRLLALQTRRFHWLDRTRGRGEINLWTAGAATLEWRKLGCLATLDKVEDYGYPALVPLGDGRWYAVFYAGALSGPSAIWSVTFTLDEEPEE
ncbi:MAG: sialidase family protein [Kiritimatiellia bacterium]|jgi:hypothetical protein